MRADQWAEVERLYHSAMALEPSERRVFIEAALSTDNALRQELESLLLYEGDAAGFLARPLLGGTAAFGGRLVAGIKPGDTFSHFQVICLLGSGGMGEVYRARDLRLDREVALKVLSPSVATRPGALARFEREAKAVAALCHPSIVAIHEFGYERGIPFEVTELLEGQSLRALLHQSPLPWRRAVEIGIHIAEGLEIVHAKNITHRDLKPENIFITTDDKVKILDFGLAHMKQPVAEDTAGYLTEPGVVMGTVGYMSPEQTEAKDVDARSDIFSFGTVLYEMITGRQPFQGASKISTLAAILHVDPKPVREIAAGVPRSLEAVVARCLGKRPDERFQTMESVRAALQRVIRKGSFALPWSGSRRRVAAAIAAALVLAVGATALWGELGRLRRKPAVAHVGRAEAVSNLYPADCFGPPHSIVGWWHGDGATGDLVGRTDGIASVGLRFGPGKVGQAFSFDGVASHVRLGVSPLLAPSSITVEFWINLRSVRPDYTHPAARWGHIHTRSANSWLFDIEPDSIAYFCVQTDISRIEACARTKRALSLNTWHHVAGTYDSSESKIRMYLDGRLEGEQEHHGKIQANESTAVIGCKWADASCMYPLDGLVDEFSIYQRALTPEEIQDIFSAGAMGKCRPKS
jgi:hypothetical protein